ncbi:hypothetical protein LOC67_22720 [Stieleria sp. JC731]|uniref:hypothetical protein n=1 Tax=Stieleria sp. JC731 TaxID=2894195 RepID=UPI001E36EA22|nr:hypothetical protein [Stieleria sp. JC731]MCC9603373.1 hypothetical protein [Stieleria sp. JC731]
MNESNLANVRHWLLNRTTTIDWIDHQDGVWCLSSAFPPSVLINLYETPDAIPSRRDQILYAIAVHLEMLLTPGESCDDTTENDRELTISFARENWDDILRIDREMGLSGDFDLHVVPAMADRG